MGCIPAHHACVSVRMHVSHITSHTCGLPHLWCHHSGHRGEDPLTVHTRVVLCEKEGAAIGRLSARRLLSPMRDEHYDCPPQWDRLRLSDIDACASSETCEFALLLRRIDIKHSHRSCPGVQSCRGVRVIVWCAIGCMG